MRKFILASLAALAIGSAAFVQPADAACWWNGFAWRCSHPHAWWWHHHPSWRYGYWHGHWWHHPYAYYR
jgi:Spy/CpxP family protein refolding chaperone